MATPIENASLVVMASGAEVPPRWQTLALRLKYLLGVDRAIAYTVLARAIQILGSAGTVLLILRLLTPVEQGYYYTLLSLVSLQVVFELGFSFVILQMAAHECAHLTLHADGHIEGESTAHVRLASILQKTLRWYLAAAVILCASLLPVGVYFFSRNAETTPVAWQGPWAGAVLATAFLFLLNPFLSFLEGCGLVWQVGRMRFAQALLGAAMSWAALLSHHGLYSPAMVNLGYAAGSLAFLYNRRSLCLGLLRHPVRGRSISWRSEVWPFQWKIAVSWACAYFTIQIFTPLLFAYRGPAEAGQFGLSLSITTYLSALAIAWMSTKAAPFGQMIARGELQQLKGLFFRTLRQSLIVLVGISAACEAGVIALQHLFPPLAARMASPQIFVLLLLTSMSAFIVQSMAIYLRSFKREPFLVQSTVVAVSTVILALLAAKRWSVVGVALSYFVCTGAIGLVYGMVVFRRSPADNRSESLSVSRARRRSHRAAKATPERVLITGGREVGGLTAFAAGLSEGFTALGIPSEVVSPGRIFKRWRDLRDPGVLKILSTTAVFAAPLARGAICVAHGFPRADTQGWGRMVAILGSFKLANSCSQAPLVAVSDYVAAHLRGPFNLRVDAVIRNPVQSSFLEPTDESGERCYLTYVGRLFPAKNVHRLLPAMCELQKENPGLRVCVIGDGPQRGALQRLFQTDPAIEFTGNLDAPAVRSYLQRTKIFVSGNEMEPFGITYLEALSQGCVVAMPACGGGLEIALPFVGTKVQLLPLSFDREGCLNALRCALKLTGSPVSLAAYEPKAVAGAYRELQSSHHQKLSGSAT